MIKDLKYEVKNLLKFNIMLNSIDTVLFIFILILVFIFVIVTV